MVGEGFEDSVSKADRLLIELRVTQSETSFVAELDRNMTVGRAAGMLAKVLLPNMDTGSYLWTFIKRNKPLADDLTLRMAGIKSGSTLKLVGNHRYPQWAPSIVLDTPRIQLIRESPGYAEKE